MIDKMNCNVKVVIYCQKNNFFKEKKKKCFDIVSGGGGERKPEVFISCFFQTFPQLLSPNKTAPQGP